MYDTIEAGKYQNALMNIFMESDELIGILNKAQAEEPD
jgi:hypothetical protein